MPSRKLSIHCKSCNQKNHLRSKYCNECGSKIDSKPLPSDSDGRTRLHRDIAHPITPAFREFVQEHVIKAYEDEKENVMDSQEVEHKPQEVEHKPQEVEHKPQEVEHKSQEMEEEDGYESSSSGSTKKGSGFEEYDEIIASLKGAQNARSEDNTEATDRASDNDSHDRDDSHDSDDAPKQTSSSFLDDDEENEDNDNDDEIVSSNEETESSTVTNYDQGSESINQTTSVDSDDEGAFGEGIL